MDGIRGEVSNKIRSAIKAKLMELGAYVDDELPDYIMVMVANKRSRQQMEEDLQLFLGDSTITFTAWLHTVLSKLQQVTVNSTELKRSSDKKRPLPDDEKKEKKKKVKKEKEKSEKASEGKGKPDDKSTGDRVNESNHNAQLIQNKQIKSEPVDLIGDEDSLLNDNRSQSAVVNAPTKSQNNKISELKIHEEEEDDDFINLKADVEADMWGEAEETSALVVRSSNVESTPSSENTSDPRPTNSRFSEIQQESRQSSSTSLKAATKSTLVKDTIVSTNSSPLKPTPETTPAPRIIRISETIRQEQESLKQSSKPVRDSQVLAKRVFQSLIVSQKAANDKAEKSQNRTSLSYSDSHARRNEPRSNRKHEHQDLRYTLRKERQRERDHGRERDREQRRSRQLNPPRKSQAAVASVVRAPPHDVGDDEGPDLNIQSVVRVKPRPQIPASLQANRSLILKAVAEAQKSVSKVVIRPEIKNSKSNVCPKIKAGRRQSNDMTVVHKEQSKVKIQHPAKKEQPKLKQISRLPPRETLRKMSFTVLGEKAVPNLSEESDEGSIILDPSLNILIQVPSSPAEESVETADPARTEKVQRWIKDVEEATKSDIVSPNVNAESTEADAEADTETFSGIETDTKHVSDDELEELDDALEADISDIKASGILLLDEPKKQTTGTQFVVTLDGLDPRLLQSFVLEDSVPKQQPHDMLIECAQEQQENIREELAKEQLLRLELLRQQAAVREQKKSFAHPASAVQPLSVPVNPQVKRPASPSGLESRPLKVVTAQNRNLNLERCKFWPTCKNGDKCEFHHPSSPCKLFPNCKFADRCLYIHPNCRFNSACTRADCSFNHTGPRPVHITPSSGPSHLGSQTIKQACKFFPNCSNLSCPYIHPTVCKFGTNCTKPKCQFIHSDKTLMTKHKWVRH